jgi:hypothetical protein
VSSSRKAGIVAENLEGLKNYLAPLVCHEMMLAQRVPNTGRNIFFDIGPLSDALVTQVMHVKVYSVQLFFVGKVPCFELIDSVLEKLPI